VELCSGLVEGGLTPSIGLISAVRRALSPSVLVMVLIRPRSGDFVYDSIEMDVMLEDIRACRRARVDGVVSGVMLPSGCIDEERTKLLMEAAGYDSKAPVNSASTGSTSSAAAAASATTTASDSTSDPHPPLLFTFHRAFDLVPDLPAALETLIQLGVPRMLTSGGCNDVLAGQRTIKALVRQSAGRITVLAGGGVTEENAAGFVASTGVTELHGSLRSFRWGATIPSARKAGVYMGGVKQNDGLEVEYGLKTADEGKIRHVVDALRIGARS
jgi:copper homeostasis protein